MSDISEVKELFSKTETAVAVLRSEFEDSQKKSADYVTEDKLKKIEADVAKGIEAETKAGDLQRAADEAKRRLDEIEAKVNRPGGPDSKTDDADMKSFKAWAKGAQGTEFEAKSMTAGENPGGGFTIPHEMQEGIQERTFRSSPVRSVANVISIEGNTYDILAERGEAGHEWSGETDARNETGNPTIDRITINLHELSAKPKASQKLLDDSKFDVASWLEQRVAEKFARAEATAFVTGDGVIQPKGFLTHTTSTSDDSERSGSALQYVATGTSGGFDATNPADDLIDLIHKLHPTFRGSAVFMAKSTTAAAIAKFKDGDGRYLLQRFIDGDNGVLQTLMSQRLLEAEDMPAIAANSLSLAFGDFSAGYTVVDGPGVRVLRDPYSAKPYVQFYTTKRVGGGVSNFDAIKLMKFGTS